MVATTLSISLGSSTSHSASPATGMAKTGDMSTSTGTSVSTNASTPATKTSEQQTQPRRRRRSSVTKGPLKDVVAIVDVRVGADAQIDCSGVVAEKLRELGATTVKRFTPKLTHMVLSHFSEAWKAKIAKWQATRGGSMSNDLIIASQLWVNACYVSKTKMAERPFFPVSQTTGGTPSAAAAFVAAGHAGRRRQSLGSGPSQPLDATTTEKSSEALTLSTKDTSAPSTPYMTSFQPVKTTMTATRRKRRTQSMEPMTSDAILKLLETTEPEPTTTTTTATTSTPMQPVQRRDATSSSKRRKTGSGPPSVDKSPNSQASGDTTVASECVPESDSENEKVVEEKDKSADGTKETPVDLMSPNASQKTNGGEFAVDTGSDQKKEPTARELRRANRRNSASSYGAGLALKSGIWSCAACGCSNLRTSRFCKECHTAKGVAKANKPANGVSAASEDATAAPKTPVKATKPATSTETTPRTMTRSKSTPVIVLATPSPATKSRKTPSPLVADRTPRSVTRATASSAAKMRTPSPASRPAKASGSASKTKTPSPAPKTTTAGDKAKSTRASSSAPSSAPAAPSKKTKRSAVANTTPHEKMTSRLSSTSTASNASTSVSVAKKTPRKPPTTGYSSAMKLTQSAAKKRVRPAGSSSDLTTPVVKKRRGDNKENTLDDKFTATPGSVSCFPRKYRNMETPVKAIPLAMKFSSTTSKKPARKMRNIIGITGVDSETRGVILCAIHAIDASMSDESEHRKARVVKSLDYSAGVTHLIVGKETRRTIKVLFAIARGAWIVSEGWAFSSLEKERWLPEEDFELTMFANKHSRLHPESRQILKGMRFFVGSNVEPSREVLQSLIQCAGGEICNQISVADMCICGDGSLFRRAQRTGIRVVTSKWVFDSIANMKLEDDAEYGMGNSESLSQSTVEHGKPAQAGSLETASSVLE